MSSVNCFCLQADGTRYLLLLCQWGAYVIDRSYRIRRVQLRAPTVGKPHMHKQFGWGPHALSSRNTGITSKRCW